MGWARGLKAPAARAAIPAVVLCGGLACGMLASCEYTYDDGRAPVSSAPPTAVTAPAPPRDPMLGQTVTGDELRAWARDVLPDVNGLSFYNSYGLLSAGESRTEETVQLPGGTYAVTLACRGSRSAGFSVRNGDQLLFERMLQCGATRVNILHLEKDAILSITVSATASANFAYRVSRI